MRSRLTPLIKLFYNPLQAMIEISAGAPYVTGAVLALVATFVYYELLGGTFLRMIAAFGRQSQRGLAAPLIVLVFNVVRAMFSHVSPVLFLVVIFVPACLLATSVIHQTSEL